MERLRRQLGLDQPLHVQLWLYLKSVLTLDLGFSHRQQQPVARLVAERLAAAPLLVRAGFLSLRGREFVQAAEVLNHPRHPCPRALPDSIPGRAWTPPALKEPA